MFNSYWIMLSNVQKVQGVLGHAIDCTTSAARKRALDQSISEGQSKCSVPKIWTRTGGSSLKQSTLIELKTSHRSFACTPVRTALLWRNSATYIQTLSSLVSSPNPFYVSMTHRWRYFWRHHAADSALAKFIFFLRCIVLFGDQGTMGTAYLQQTIPAQNQERKKKKISTTNLPTEPPPHRGAAGQN